MSAAQAALRISTEGVPPLLVGGDEVSCRPAELRILLLLARRPRCVVSSTELWDRAFPDPDGASQGQVSWHLCRLRRRHPLLRRWIVTVPGRGYALALDPREVRVEGLHSDV